MAATEERLLSEGEGGAPGSARLSPPPLSQSPEAPGPLEQPPQSNTLMGLPIVAIESILSFLSYDETSQLRLVGAGEGREGGRGAVPRPTREPPEREQSRGGGGQAVGQGWGFPLLPAPRLPYGRAGVRRARVPSGTLPPLNAFDPIRAL